MFVPNFTIKLKAKYTFYFTFYKKCLQQKLNLLTIYYHTDILSPLYVMLVMLPPHKFVCLQSFYY